MRTFGPSRTPELTSLVRNAADISQPADSEPRVFPDEPVATGQLGQVAPRCFPLAHGEQVGNIQEVGERYQAVVACEFFSVEFLMSDIRLPRRYRVVLVYHFHFRTGKSMTLHDG